MNTRNIGHGDLGTKRLGLGLFTIAVFLASLFMGSPASALVQTQSGPVRVTAAVQGPPPTTAATIDSPRDGDSTQSKTITVSGSCAAQDLIVSIIDNGNFVGSTTCSASGSFSLSIDLTPGANRLIAREEDSLNQFGPDSAAVTITYVVSTSSSSTPSSSTTASSSSPTTTTTVPASPAVVPLTIELDPHYVGYVNKQSNQSLDIPLKINGGTAPYAVHVDWGDGNDSLLTQTASGSFIVSHNYTNAGIYQVTIQASDSAGQKTTLHVAIVINGQPSIVSQKLVPKSESNFYWWTLSFSSLIFLIIGYLIGSRLHRKPPKGSPSTSPTVTVG